MSCSHTGYVNIIVMENPNMLDFLYELEAAMFKFKRGEG